MYTKYTYIKVHDTRDISTQLEITHTHTHTHTHTQRILYFLTTSSGCRTIESWKNTSFIRRSVIPYIDQTTESRRWSWHTIQYNFYSYTRTNLAWIRESVRIVSA